MLANARSSHLSPSAIGDCDSRIVTCVRRLSMTPDVQTMFAPALNRPADVVGVFAPARAARLLSGAIHKPNAILARRLSPDNLF